MAYDYNAAQPRARVKRTGKAAQNPNPDVKPQKPENTKQSNTLIFKPEKEIDKIQHEKLEPFDVEYDDNTDFPFLDYKKNK